MSYGAGADFPGLSNSKPTSAINKGLDENVSSLYKAWSKLLSDSSQSSSSGEDDSEYESPPHFENCRMLIEMNHRLDTRLRNGSYPPWTIWKGKLDDLPLGERDEQLKYYRDQIIAEGNYPPWVSGSDVENYPMTRKVQRDLWLHQHPVSCNDPSVKFLLADWERSPGFGIGAQLAGMTGLLAIAVNEKRVLVTGYYNRADHDGCKGSSRSSWSCYFFPETSTECKNRALELMNETLAWQKGLMTRKENYTSKDIWSGRTPK
ncbi:hypothetical protein M569_04580 [Genlisea aurea]|uniref:Uncharacterized protein n=1 Tax=Genlisea aurea TaxID=192259 RepID=S8EC83_9LAMI|nr:hypothetical protein M569_04580 [Genlisea aurea]